MENGKRRKEDIQSVLRRAERQLQREVRADDEWWNPFDLVFPTSKGRSPDRDRPNEMLKPLLRNAGLPTIRVHDLGHTAATVMLIQGVHPIVVQEMLGHSTITTTMDTYSHVLPTMHDEAVRRLNEALDRSPRDVAQRRRQVDYPCQPLVAVDNAGQVPRYHNQEHDGYCQANQDWPDRSASLGLVVLFRMRLH
jgi:hypothetical protein